MQPHRGSGAARAGILPCRCAPSSTPPRGWGGGAALSTGGYGFLASGRSGATTPIEMTYLSASSTFVELDDVGLADHQEESRGGIRRGRDIDAQIIPVEVIGDIAARPTGQKRDRPTAFAGILHEQCLAERLPAGRKQRIAHLFDAAVDGLHDRDA